VFGPLLFAIFTISDALSVTISSADDLQIYLHFAPAGCGPSLDQGSHFSCGAVAIGTLLP